MKAYFTQERAQRQTHAESWTTAKNEAIREKRTQCSLNITPYQKRRLKERADKL